MTNQKVLVIGGSSGIGLEVAREVCAHGAHVVIAGRSNQRLEQARERLGGERVETFSTDIGNQQEVEALLSRVGSLDHLVITAADLPYGPIQTLSEDDLLRAVRSKFLGPVFAVQHAAPRLRPGGSITLTAGIASSRPIRGGATAAALNGGVEALTRALAIELAPIRGNAVSPGWTDTPVWDKMPGMTLERKTERFGEMARKLPVQRIGRTEDVAAAIRFLMTNEFTTGTVLHVDGGQPLV